MDFSATDEQRMLENTVQRLMRERYGFEDRAACGREAGGHSAAVWATFAELGLLAIPFTEADGGLLPEGESGGVEIDLLFRAFGQALSREPYLATVLLAGRLIAALGNDQQLTRWLPGLQDGSTRFALALLEADSGHDPYWVSASAVRATDGSFVLNGAKPVVLNGDSADELLVVARTTGTPGDRDGLAVFVVSADSAGLTRTGYPTIDGLSAAALDLSKVTVSADRLLAGGAVSSTADALDEVLDLGRLALCSEAVGAMIAACDITLDYLKTRQQFGTPIGRFQVLQHRMVDMRVALEEATSITLLAATGLNARAERRALLVSGAKSLVGRRARLVAEHAIQMHGGMGMTDEAAISHYAKRLVMIDHWLGDADWHNARFEKLSRQVDPLDLEDEAA